MTGAPDSARSDRVGNSETTNAEVDRRRLPLQCSILPRAGPRLRLV